MMLPDHAADDEVLESLPALATRLADFAAGGQAIGTEMTGDCSPTIRGPIRVGDAAVRSRRAAEGRAS